MESTLARFDRPLTSRPRTQVRVTSSALAAQSRETPSASAMMAARWQWGHHSKPALLPGPMATRVMIPCTARGVYVFARNGDSWDQQAYVKASNPGQGDNFGFATALSADGGTMAVSANFEASNATGVNGDQDDDSILQAGAVYLFVRNIDSGWSQQAYLKASNTGEAGTEDEPWSDGDQFGFSVALSDDGNTLAVGAMAEDSAAPGVNGDESDNSLQSAGAVLPLHTQRHGLGPDGLY